MLHLNTIIHSHSLCFAPLTNTKLHSHHLSIASKNSGISEEKKHPLCGTCILHCLLFFFPFRRGQFFSILLTCSAGDLRGRALSSSDEYTHTERERYIYIYRKRGECVGVSAHDAGESVWSWNLVGFCNVRRTYMTAVDLSFAKRV